MSGRGPTSERLGTAVVSSLIIIRVIAAVLFLCAFLNDLRVWAVCVFFLACLTDVLDGHLARRLGGLPSLGVYCDATADFLLVLAAFSAFAVKDIYPFWTLLLIGAMFLQFVLSSGLKRPLYDPVGKYYGVFLFAAIGVTLVFPRAVVYTGVLVGILGFTVASLVSRAVFFLRRWRRAKCSSRRVKR